MNHDRSVVIERCRATISAMPLDGCRLVAIDGPDAVGKTAFAADLVVALKRADVSVVAVGVDAFHHPAAIRYRRADSEPARSFYEDSYDYDALEDRLLRPARGDLPVSVTTSIFDVRADEAKLGEATVSDGSVLLVEGIFLSRPRLRSWWDLVIYLDAPPEVSLERGSVRDAGHVGGLDAARERYELRYLPGQELYRAESSPVDRAEVVVDMSDPQHPTLVRP